VEDVNKMAAARVLHKLVNWLIPSRTTPEKNHFHMHRIIIYLLCK